MISGGRCVIEDNTKQSSDYIRMTTGWPPPLIWLSSRAIIINRPGVAGVILQTPHCVTKGSHLKKKSASIWNSSKRPWPPPPPCTFGTLWGTFLKPYFIWTKVPQSVWILAILPPFPWKMSKPKQKKYLIIFGIRQPPPSSWKMSKLKPKSSSKLLELGKHPSLSWKISKQKQKSSSKSLEIDNPPPLSEKCPNMNRTRKFLETFGFGHDPPPLGKIPNRGRFFLQMASLNSQLFS